MDGDFDVGVLAGQNPTALGNSETIRPGETKDLLILQKKLAAPSVLNLVLDIKPIENQNDINLNKSSIQPMVRALLKWGTGKNGRFEATLDFARGTQIGLAAEDIFLKVQYDYTTLKTEINPVALNDLPNFRVSAGIGYGAVGRNATFTELVQVDDVTKSEIIQIPYYTRRFTVQPINDSKFKVKIFGLAENLFVEYEINPGEHDHFEIFNGAQFLEITSNDGKPGFAFAVFDLAF